MSMTAVAYASFVPIAGDRMSQDSGRGGRGGRGERAGRGGRGMSSRGGRGGGGGGRGGGGAGRGGGGHMKRAGVSRLPPHVLAAVEEKTRLRRACHISAATSSTRISNHRFFPHIQGGTRPILLSLWPPCDINTHHKPSMTWQARSTRPCPAAASTSSRTFGTKWTRRRPESVARNRTAGAYPVGPWHMSPATSSTRVVNPRSLNSDASYDVACSTRVV
jgi:hypothetical protein